ncbi:hypothetical protein FV232_23020 [Methylobacterium sp. WL30]|nr:hypothetical protein FV225_05540 [Methylobacterium sp. WL93]TXN51533.1 hypothetical protein FV227_07050 [Methylobacterium sp. WL119]TXN63538.1 hypothetical protein FV232_23020 [Methylobacterium sp. WL30]
MPTSVAAKKLPVGEVTFLGRGQGVLTGLKLLLRVCPQCSQRNARQTEAKGYCQWCAYVPSLGDVEPARST